MTPQCAMLTRLFLLIAVPLTVVWWGGFWVVRRHWHAVAWAQGEHRRFLLADPLVRHRPGGVGRLWYAWRLTGNPMIPADEPKLLREVSIARAG